MLFLFSLLDIFFSDIFWKFFLWLFCLPLSLSLLGFGSLTHVSVSIRNSLNRVVMVLEIWSWDPLLVVKSEEYFDWFSKDLCESLSRDLFPTPKPGQRWYDALQAPPLAVPIGGYFSFSPTASELHPLDGGVVDALTEDVDRGSSF